MLFETRAEVIAALKRYRDAFVPKTGSIIFASRSDHDPTADPFRAGFLSGIEVRDELIRRMISRIAPRERLLLILWYVTDIPVARIARKLDISRMHCYRLRNHAVDALCDEIHSSDNPRNAGRGDETPEARQKRAGA